MDDPISILIDTISSIYIDNNIPYNNKLESISRICMLYTQNLNRYMEYMATKNNMSDQLSPQERKAVTDAWSNYPDVVNQLLSNPTLARAELAKNGIVVQNTSIPSPNIPRPSTQIPSPTQTPSTGKPRKFANRVFSSKNGNLCANLTDLNEGYGLAWFKPLKDGRMGLGIAKGSIAVDMHIQGNSVVLTSTLKGLSQQELDFLRQSGVIDNDIPLPTHTDQARIRTKHTIDTSETLEHNNNNIEIPTDIKAQKEDQEIIKQAKALSQALDIDYDTALQTIKRSIVNTASKRKRGMSKDIPPPNIFTGDN